METTQRRKTPLSSDLPSSLAKSTTSTPELSKDIYSNNSLLALSLVVPLAILLAFGGIALILSKYNTSDDTIRIYRQDNVLNYRIRCNHLLYFWSARCHWSHSIIDSSHVHHTLDKSCLFIQIHPSIILLESPNDWSLRISTTLYISRASRIFPQSSGFLRRGSRSNGESVVYNCTLDIDVYHHLVFMSWNTDVGFISMFLSSLFRLHLLLRQTKMSSTPFDITPLHSYSPLNSTVTTLCSPYHYVNHTLHCDTSQCLIVCIHYAE